MSWLYAAQARTEAYLKPSNEICNVLISFLSFNGGIERREGLGLYYHTLWREGRGREGERGYEGERERERVWAAFNPCMYMWRKWSGGRS